MSYTLVLEWMPGDLYMSAVTARCTAPTSSYSVVWLPPNKVYQITLYCGSTSLVSFLVGAFRGKAWSYMRKRNHIIPLHLNKKELAHLEAQVKTSGLPREEFLRSLIMGAELRARPCDHHADLLHKVAGLCNNANQLARVANTYGEAGPQSIEEMTKLARQVWEEVKENW